jgi:3-oxo-5-alpha-steroid 4-dehydrogenase 3
MCSLGGLFELVSCPHYLAEVVIYLGLFIASQGRLLPLLMLTWVVSAAARWLLGHCCGWDLTSMAASFSKAG